MGSMDTMEKPHAVCVPFPGQGHIKPMLMVAKLLHHRGFHITFVNTEFNHKRLLKSRGPDALDGHSSFRFETIPDGLPPSDADATQDIIFLCESTKKTCSTPFKNLLSKLNDTDSSNVPKVTCVIADGAMGFTLDAANELGIPDVLFWTVSACGFMGYVHYQQLIEKGHVSLKDASQLTKGSLDTNIDWIPGMDGIRLKDLPSFIRNTEYPNNIMIDFVIDETERTHKASALILNTFYDMEPAVLDALSTIYPSIYTIGPLHSLLNQISDDDDLMKFIGWNLWKEDHECIEWLDSKQPNSVFYVNFGSITVMTPQQLIEFAWGLCNSNQAFLWVIRPDLVTGGSGVLPPEFLRETRERGLLSNWCPQEQVLAHPSIAGFLTHSGWNSTLESVSCGVPMICWPFFAEQQTNCYYSCAKWGIGMEIDSDVKRDEVESLVRELMLGEKGKKMKEKAMEWKKLAEEATTGPAGSSFINLNNLIDQVLLPPRD